MSDHSFFTSVTAFFMGYLDIDNSLYDSYGVLSKKGIQICAKYLIDEGVFLNEKELKKEALKSFNIILPEWIFNYEKE